MPAAVIAAFHANAEAGSTGAGAGQALQLLPAWVTRLMLKLDGFTAGSGFHEVIPVAWAAAPAPGVARAGRTLRGPGAQPGERQAEHVPEVVAGVGQQRERPGVPAGPGLETDEGGIERDAEREDATLAFGGQGGVDVTGAVPVGVPVPVPVIVIVIVPVIVPGVVVLWRRHPVIIPPATAGPAGRPGWRGGRRAIA